MIAWPAAVYWLSSREDVRPYIYEASYEPLTSTLFTDEMELAGKAQG